MDTKRENEKFYITGAYQALGAIIFWGVFAVSLYSWDRYQWGIGVDQIEVFYGQIK